MKVASTWTMVYSSCGRGQKGSWDAERGGPPEGGYGGAPDRPLMPVGTSATAVPDLAVVWNSVLLSLWGGAEVAMHGRIHQSVVLKKNNTSLVLSVIGNLLQGRLKFRRVQHTSNTIEHLSREQA